jgi:hypothetical protein
MKDYDFLPPLSEYKLRESGDEIGYIYLLFDDKENLLYVGQTIYLENRICTHRKNKKIPFSICKYFICDRCELNDKEFEIILTCSPPYNNGPPPINRIWVSLDQAKRKFPNFKGNTHLLKKHLRMNACQNFHGHFHIEDLKKIHETLFGGF